MTQPIVLNYRGSAGLDDMNAFNARTHVGLKGDMLFRIYLTDQQLYFIKVGGSNTQGQMIAIQFGLLGALSAYYLNKRNKKKTQQKLNSVAGVSPEQLLAQDKVNTVAPLDAFSELALNAGSFWNSARYGTWTFRDAKGKKRVYRFDDGDNFEAAAQRLGVTFGERLEVKGRWDASRKRVVRVQ
jgi:hypothetical protein